LAAIVLLLTRSPIAFGTALVSVAVLAALYGIRSAPKERQPILQGAAIAIAVIAAIVAWIFRGRIVELLNGGGELQYRLELWREMWSLIRLSPVEGWGWIGQWNTELPPYSAFKSGASRAAESALNAYLDVWFQVGVIGLALFIVMVGLAFVRSWLLASRQRSVIYTWPAVVLAALLTASLAESLILYGFGWMTFVICCVKASQSLSWRVAFRRPLEQEPLG
ncbi:MAG: O-antigen ligase family protein, partial [Solirubrobacterales bacterium]